MKKILLLCCYFWLGISIQAQEKKDGIQFFEGTFNEALVLAKQEGKLIFMDCYGTYCAGCILLEKNVFPLKDVGEFYNENFICLKRDMGAGEGVELCKRYNVVGFPTLLFIDEDGYVIHIGAGAMKPEEFIELGKKALNMPRKSLEKRFASGERGEEFVRLYIEHLKNFVQMDKIEDVLETLYLERGGKFLEDPYYWDLFMASAYDQDKGISIYVAKNWKKFGRLYGKEEVLQKIRNQYISFPDYTSLCDSDERGWKGVLNEERYADYIQKMEERKLPQGYFLVNEMRFLVLLQKAAYEEAYHLGERVLKKADARILCNWVTLGERRVKGREVRQKMIAWAERVVAEATDEEWRQEGETILMDLRTSDRPVFKSRKCIPIKGYDKSKKGSK